jgi:hypothetical protein
VKASRAPSRTSSRSISGSSGHQRRTFSGLTDSLDQRSARRAGGCGVQFVCGVSAPHGGDVGRWPTQPGGSGTISPFLEWPYISRQESPKICSEKSRVSATGLVDVVQHEHTPNRRADSVWVPSSFDPPTARREPAQFQVASVQATVFRPQCSRHCLHVTRTRQYKTRQHRKRADKLDSREYRLPTEVRRG